MSVKVTCHYFLDTCIGISTTGYCDYTYCFEHCKDYVPKDDRMGCACFNYKPAEAVISRTYKAVEYEDGKGLTIGKEFIPCENIRYLALDYGDGERIFINRKETTDCPIIYRWKQNGSKMDPMWNRSIV